MTEEDPKPLPSYLLVHGHRPEFTCRFRWEAGSIAFWDNRVCRHLAVHDAGPYKRIMRRIRIRGTKPGAVRLIGWPRLSFQHTCLGADAYADASSSV